MSLINDILEFDSDTTYKVISLYFIPQFIHSLFISLANLMRKM